MAANLDASVVSGATTATVDAETPDNDLSGESSVLLVDGDVDIPRVPTADTPILVASYLGTKQTWTLVRSLGELPTGPISYLDGGPLKTPSTQIPEHVEEWGAVKPADLTGASIAISKFLKGTDGVAPLVYIHGLSVVFNYVDTETVYRFLHAVLGKLKSLNATVVVSLNSAAVSDKQWSLVKSLSDGLVDE